MANKRAAVYCRISQDRTGSGLGVERQREDCEKVAAARHLDIVAVHTDNDMSAYSGKRRPGYEQLIRDVRDGSIDVVLAWHEDRLHRSPRELEDYIDATSMRSVPTYFAQSGELDLATASGRMTARIRGAVARQESEHKAERIRRKHQQSAEQGVWRGGARPYGWTLQDGGAVLNRPEAALVREATRAVLSGASLGGIVADWNRRGITTSRGNPWTYATLRQLLRRPKNAGLSELNGQIVGTMRDWPPIVTEDTWRSVCAVLDNPERRRSTSNRVRWLLSGIAVCGKDGCGEPLRSATTGGGESKRTVYRCTAGGGGHVARDALALNEHVERVVLGVFARDDWRAVLADEAPRPDGESLRAEAVVLRSRLADAADSFADGKITSAQLQRITERVQTRLSVVEAEMSSAHRGSVLEPFMSAADPEAVWRSLSIDRQRDVIREVMEIVVLPTGRSGKAYRSEAVGITWKVEQ